MRDTKTIDAKVRVGHGKEMFFKEVDYDMTQDPFSIIESIDSEIDINDYKILYGDKIIFTGWINKRVEYKTVQATSICNGNVSVNGGIKHIHRRIPFSGCVDIIMEDNYEIIEGKDRVEILEAYIIGDVEDYLEQTELKGYNSSVILYKKLQEVMCIKVIFDIIRCK